jgi:sporulation protein YlmC with PRC-barrel domain
VEKISDLKGKAIITADGKSVGELVDVSIDERSWRVVSIIVDVEPSLASLFGVGMKLLKSPLVRIAAGTVEHVGDVVKLAVELDQLEVEPRGGQGTVAVTGAELVGKDVITSDGRNVGTVTDVSIDTQRMRVRDLRVAIDRRMAEELGLLKDGKGSQFLIKTEHIRGVGDHVMLQSTMRALAEMAATARGPGDLEPLD